MGKNLIKFKGGLEVRNNAPLSSSSETKNELKKENKGSAKTNKFDE